jgi:hypothetical protein
VQKTIKQWCNTLPENIQQVFVSKYKLYLPPKEELVRELEREQAVLEPLIAKERRLETRCVNTCP